MKTIQPVTELAVIRQADGSRWLFFRPDHLAPTGNPSAGNDRHAQPAGAVMGLTDRVR